MNNYSKIIVTPPGPKARLLLEKEERYISPSLHRFYPLFIDSGRDCLIRDVDGNEFIDFDSGSSCLNVGHCNEEIIKSINDQAKKYIHYPWGRFHSEITLNLGEKLLELTPGSYEKKIFYCASNSEAIEAATKLVSWNTRRQVFLAYLNAFHGDTLAATSFTSDNSVRRRHFPKLNSSIIHIPYPYCYRCPFKLTYPECNYLCVDFIEDNYIGKHFHPEEIAALLLEPIQGEGGIIVPPKEYFNKLKKLLGRYDILLVDDEAQTSLARTGRWFAIEHWKVIPDVMCFSNSLASGLPLAVTISKAELMDWESGSHFNFLGGNALACSAALKAIEIIQKESIIENSIKQGNYLMRRLSEMKENYDMIGDVRGKGLMVGVEIIKKSNDKTPNEDEAKEIMEKCFRRGLIITMSGSSILRITPPLTIKREMIDKGLEIIESSIKEVYHERLKK